MNKIIKTIGFVTCLLILVIHSVMTFAQEKGIEEDTLKALYSYKFTLFTEWPEDKLNSQQASLGFCIVGKNPFGSTALAEIEGKGVKQKIMHIDIFESGLLSEESMSSCHVLYISISEIQRMPALLNSLHHFPILTISDIPGFSSQGGMVTLTKSDDHLKFEINPDAISQAKLEMSSKIMELATLVKTSHKEQK